MNKIPKSFTVGGQDIEVEYVEFCEDSCLGDIILGQGKIRIAEYVSRNVPQSETSKLNTFYHELTHAILITMGEYDLNGNEKFVCTFSGFFNRSYQEF